MNPVIESTLQTADGYWTVEVIRYGPRQRWYRISYAGAVKADRVPLATVQRILGDTMTTLEPLVADEYSTD